MKPISCLSIFILFLLLSICPAGNNHAYAWVEGKELAVVPASKETVEILNESGVDIEQISEGKIRIWATREELDRLAQLGIPYIILHDEMQAERNFYNQWKSRREFMFYTFGTEMEYELDYHSYNDMITVLQDLEAKYPSICKMVDVGDTVNGRKIWAVVISDNVNIEENEPEVKLEGGIHGDEWSSTEVPLDIAKYLCQNYSPGSGNDATFIVDNLETWIIPMRNADGHESNSRYNARGVDLNRNFDGPAGCAQGNPSCFSEPETQSVRNMFDIMGKRFCLGISYHSGAQCLSSLWSYDCIAPPDEEIFWHNRTTCSNNSWSFNEIPAPDGLADAYDTSDLPENWGWTTGAEWYVVTGGDKDYSYWDWGMLITTIECTKTKTPASTEIQTFLAWHRQPTLNYLKKAMQGIHGLVTDAETGQPLDATIEIQGKSMPIFTDPDVGDYHRVLMPGTYTVIASAEGYVTRTLPDITVTADTGTILDIRLMGAGSPTVGNTAVFGSTSNRGNRRAMPFTMPESGTIMSISMYHNGGSGNMVLAVYGGEASPVNRLGVTEETAVSPTPGWQTIDLIAPVSAQSGDNIWLAWVFENNPGIRYQSGSPGRGESEQDYSSGMPDPFGSSTQANYIYSIYATYTTMDNLLVNSSFEYDTDGDNNPDDWIIIEPVERDSNEYVDGQYSAKIESTEVINNINRQNVYLKPYTTYTLIAWIKTENVTGEGAQVYPYDYGGMMDPSQWIRVVGTTGWSYYSVQFTTGEDPSKASINFGLNHAAGRAWFDDIKLLDADSDCALNPSFQEITVQVGEQYYTDRDYTTTNGVPSWMVGRTMIKTPNDERFNDWASSYIRFNTPISWWVYVLFDSRASVKPDWLSNWQFISNYKIYTSLSSQPYLEMWRKYYEAGQCVNLGGNFGPGSSDENRSNYTVVYGK